MADDTTIIRNPERGIYRHTETHDATYTKLDKGTLDGYMASGYSLILRVFYIESHMAGLALGYWNYLTWMNDDFNVAREAGMKVIVRFAYRGAPPNGWEGPYWDAQNLNVILDLDELKPTLDAHWDVIAVVQAGFVGLWGEWWYTDHFGPPGHSPSESSLEKRAQIIDKWLSVLPSQRSIQLRTPTIKRQAMAKVTNPQCGTNFPSFPSCDDPLPAVHALDTAHKAARLGHHNDCFLASSTDFGTYQSYPAGYTADTAYLHRENRYLPMGGETCAVNVPRTQCSTATAEMEYVRYSYLNLDWHPDVISGWQTEPAPCWDDIRRKLGYRLTLESAELPTNAGSGGLSVTLRFRNNGWAAPFNHRHVSLVLKAATSSHTICPSSPSESTPGLVCFNFTMSGEGVGGTEGSKISSHPAPGSEITNLSPQFWLPGLAITLSETFPLASVPAGNYAVHLHLPDPAPSLRARPEYAIRLATQGLPFDTSTGFHALDTTVTVG